MIGVFENSDSFYNKPFCPCKLITAAKEFFFQYFNYSWSYLFRCILLDVLKFYELLVKKNCVKKFSLVDWWGVSVTSILIGLAGWEDRGGPPEQGLLWPSFGVGGEAAGAEF